MTEEKFKVDVSFKTKGSKIPIDHGYVLFSALSNHLPYLHEKNEIGVHCIRGVPIESFLNIRGPLKFRASLNDVPKILTLEGKTIYLANHPIKIGPVGIYPLRPSRLLYSRITVIKGFEEAECFRDSLNIQIEKLNVKCRTEIGKRRVLKVKDKIIVGFEVSLHDLSETDSLTIQYNGLGGKSHMGCGIFTGKNDL
jgi:CRISPR-associated protein Cas6